jgi:excisionase family DNA binding protein
MTQLLTVPEVAGLLRLHPVTVYKMAQDGRIPGRKKIGRAIRFEQKTFNEWKEQGVSKPIPPLESSFNVNLQLKPYGTIRSGGLSEMAKAKATSRLNQINGAVFQRKSKKWGVRFYVDYRDSTGKRVQKVVRHARSEEEAWEHLRRLTQEEILGSGSLGFNKGHVMFEDFADAFHLYYVMPNYKKGSRERSRTDGLSEFFKGNGLRDITPMMIEKFKAHRLSMGNKRSTVNRYLAVMKGMYTLAIKEGLVSDNPVKKVRLYSEADSIKERILINDEEQRLMANAPAHLKPVLVVALNTGMRLGEIMNLEWKHIDFVSKRIRVEKTKSYKVRFISINPPLLSELARLKDSSDGSPYIFVNPQTGNQFTTFRRSFVTACKRAEIQGLRFHDLRHTFASRLIQRGADIETVRSLLGHYSIVTTQRYTHSDDEAKRRAVGLLAKESGSERANSDVSCDNSVTNHPN